MGRADDLSTRGDEGGGQKALVAPSPPPRPRRRGQGAPAASILGLNWPSVLPAHTLSSSLPVLFLVYVLDAGLWAQVAPSTPPRARRRGQASPQLRPSLSMLRHQSCRHTLSEGFLCLRTRCKCCGRRVASSTPPPARRRGQASPQAASTFSMHRHHSYRYSLNVLFLLHVLVRCRAAGLVGEDKLHPPPTPLRYVHHCLAPASVLPIFSHGAASVLCIRCRAVGPKSLHERHHELVGEDKLHPSCVNLQHEPPPFLPILSLSCVDFSSCLRLEPGLKGQVGQ
ncbi:hypothetical protein BaRGS_00010476 [Batillaria attramentaria]|uniref:Uncharacterized protein n=1 Tax=Batillaria attramentaria TaxID=370345 RepID=A0ABD0LFS3_9CAEN